MSHRQIVAALLALLGVAPQLGAQATARSAVTPAPFDARLVDVAGLRVGGSARNLATTLTRLFGKADRVSRSQEWYAGYAAALEVNPMGCFTVPGRRSGGETGNVCVTAYLDADDIVRGIRIERVFPFLDGETFRQTMVRRYGPVSEAKEAGSYALGWGPAVARALAYDSSAPQVALTAFYSPEDDLRTRSLNGAPRIRITLQLIDAAWARTTK